MENNSGRTLWNLLWNVTMENDRGQLWNVLWNFTMQNNYGKQVRTKAMEPPMELQYGKLYGK